MGKETFRIMNILTKDIDTAIKNIAFGIDGDLKEETPVDTGWAMNNWIAQGGMPFAGTLGSNEDVDFTTANLLSAIEIMKYNVKGGQPLFITNNVPYIVELNAGSSKKAPAGFVEAIIQRVILAESTKRIGKRK